MSMVMILGGHGKVALLAAPLLVRDGHQVASVIRNPEHADEVAATGAEPVVADLESATTEELTDLMRGYDVVVWSAGAGGGNPARTRAVDQDAAIRSMDAARDAGVGHYVMVSYFGARRDHGVPEDSSFFAYAEAKAAADDYLRGTDLAWTVLGPSTLTLDEPTGRIETGPQARSGKVSRANVAEVIAAVVRMPEQSARRTITFNDGDRPIDDVIADRG